MRSFAAFILLPIFILTVGGCQASGDPPAGANGAEVAAYQTGKAGIDDDSDFQSPETMTDMLVFPFKAIGDGFSAAFSGPADLIQKASGNNAHKAVVEMLDKNSPDTRRDGLNRLQEFDFTHRPPYTKVYEGMAETDSDSTVRAAAIRACNRSRDRNATVVFIKSLGDENFLVKLEACKGLANVPDSNAAVPLGNLAANADEDRDVRIAATDALKYYRTLEIARTLAGLLSDHDFGVCWQARRSLVYMTHRDFGYDQAAWLGYFVGPERPIQ